MLVLLFTLLLGSCKHEVIPPPVSNSPIFGVEGKVGQDTFSLMAGKAEVTMKPTLVESNGMKIYRGTLGNDQSYFQLQIYSGNIDFPNQPKFNPDSFNEFLFTPYNQGALWSISKSDFPNSSSIIEIKWSVNGLEQAILNDLKIDSPGKYEVCASVKYEDQSESVLCREITVGFKKNADFNLNHQVTSGANLHASIESVVGEASAVQWYLNGNPISSEFEIDTLLPQAKYTLRAEVIFENGITVNRAAVIDVSWNENGIADFASLAAEVSSVWDYKVQITYFKNGTTYRSDNEFNLGKVISVEDIVFHGKDGLGIPVYILKGSVDAILINNNNDSFPFKAKLSMGFSVK